MYSRHGNGEFAFNMVLPVVFVSHKIYLLYWTRKGVLTKRWERGTVQTGGWLRLPSQKIRNYLSALPGTGRTHTYCLGIITYSSPYLFWLDNKLSLATLVITPLGFPWKEDMMILAERGFERNQKIVAEVLDRKINLCQLTEKTFSLYQS